MLEVIAQVLYMDRRSGTCLLFCNDLNFYHCLDETNIYSPNSIGAKCEDSKKDIVDWSYVHFENGYTCVGKEVKQNEYRRSS